MNSFKSLLNFREKLNQIEAAVSSCIDFTACDLNKFYEKYFGVVNLSNRKLSLIEYSILGKGLQFCPTPTKFDHGKLKEDIDKFFRKCSLKLFFNSLSDDLVTEDQPSRFEHQDLKLPSTFNPPMPSNLEYIYNLVMEEILNINPQTPKSNITNEQKTALESLKNGKTIIIKKVDKGSNIVVMNKHDYKKEVYRQLNCEKFYRKLDSDTSMLYKEKVRTIIQKMKDLDQISDKTYKYLLEGGNRTSIFYILPKIHKSYQNPPGRPIVSSIDCPTEKISQMVDIILRDFAQKGKSFIKDTPDFLRKIAQIKLNKDEWLFTMDVQGLYTNIPHDSGLKAVEEIISHRTTPPSNNFILEMLKIVPKRKCIQI